MERYKNTMGQKGWKEKQDGVSGCSEGGMERKCLVQPVCDTTFLFRSWLSIVNHQRLQGLGFLHPVHKRHFHFHSSTLFCCSLAGKPWLSHIFTALLLIVTPMCLTRSCAQSNADQEQPREGCFFHAFILMSDTL